MKQFTRIAMIAAIYTTLCYIPGLSNLAYGQIQIRVAEALTLLPLIYQPSIWGVTLGCFLANLIGNITGMNPTGIVDIIIGTMATFLAANCTYFFREKKTFGLPLLSYSMPIVFNFIFVGIELAYIFMPESLFLGTLINGTYVAIGELVAVILGHFLVQALDRRGIFQ